LRNGVRTKRKRRGAMAKEFSVLCVRVLAAISG